MEEVKRLQEKGVDINGCDSKGQKPLFVACLANETQIVRYLLQNGVKIEVKNRNGENALFYATRSSKMDCLKFLIEHAKMNPMSVNKSGKSYMFECKHNNDPKLDVQRFAYLKTNGVVIDKEQLISYLTDQACFGVRFGFAEYLKGFLAQASRPGKDNILSKEEVKELGGKLIHKINEAHDYISVHNTFLAAIKYLLEIGAEINMRNPNGQTALEASQNGRITQLLQQHLQQQQQQ